MTEPTPRGMAAAATELVLALARLIHQSDQGHQTLDRQAVSLAQRALTGLFQVEGGRVAVMWVSRHISINHQPLMSGSGVLSATKTIQRTLGTRGIAGLLFRLLPDAEQMRLTFQALSELDEDQIRGLGAPGTAVPVPGGPSYSGIRLVLGGPGQHIDGPTGIPSGVDLTASLEDIISELNLGWIGASAPLDGTKGTLSERGSQRYCLGVYTSLMSTSLRLMRQSRALQAGDAALPTLSLHRLVQQITDGIIAVPGWLQACVLLGARDPSPARRTAHTALIAIGLGVSRGLSRRTLAELGLAAFVFGLRQRFEQFDRPQSLGDWEILRLLGREQALTSLKVRAVRTAALVGGTAEDPAALLRIPDRARIIQLASDFAGAIDGTTTGQLDDAPIPALLCLQTLSRGLDKGPSYTSEHLSALATWLGPVPPGTLVKLVDGRTAVAAPGSYHTVQAIPLLGTDGRILQQPLEPLDLGRPEALATGKSLFDGIVETRPLVHLAAQAIFAESAGLWRDIVGTPEATPPI